MTIKEGRRFTHNYLERGEPTRDSKRMRVRLASTLNDEWINGYIAPNDLEKQLGIEIPSAFYDDCVDWKLFLDDCSLPDVLDTITIVAQHLGSVKERWIGAARRILQEENLAYRVDDLGGVHFAVDAEFAHNQACTIAALQPSRYCAARTHFEEGQKALDAHPQRTREAIRQTFECVETVFKLMLPNETQLGHSEITKKLKPLVLDRLQGSERDAVGRWIEGFADWVIGAHQYRHGQGVEAPDNPSIGTAVLSVTMGAAYARWLAELDTSLQAERATA